MSEPSPTDDERDPPQRFGDFVREQMLDARARLSPPLSPRQREQRERRDAERRAADESERDG